MLMIEQVVRLTGCWPSTTAVTMSGTRQARPTILPIRVRRRPCWLAIVAIEQFKMVQHRHLCGGGGGGVVTPGTTSTTVVCNEPRVVGVQLRVAFGKRREPFWPAARMVRGPFSSLPEVSVLP